METFAIYIIPDYGLCLILFSRNVLLLFYQSEYITFSSHFAPCNPSRANASIYFLARPWHVHEPEEHS